MAFRETQFDVNISEGATGGPEFATSITVSDSGFEQRNQRWVESRGRWDIGSGVRTKADFETVLAFFRTCAGRAHGFRFKDYNDFQQTTQVNIGTGDGGKKTFQLKKDYLSGPDTYTRTITKPVSGTIRIFLDGAEVFDPADFTTDLTTGIVTFVVAPAGAVAITAIFDFDVPVRFDTDHMAQTAHFADIMEWGEIPIVEIRV